MHIITVNKPGLLKVDGTESRNERIAVLFVGIWYCLRGTLSSQCLIHLRDRFQRIRYLCIERRGKHSSAHILLTMPSL